MRTIQNARGHGDIHGTARDRGAPRIAVPLSMARLSILAFSRSIQVLKLLTKQPTYALTITLIIRNKTRHDKGP